MKRDERQNEPVRIISELELVRFKNHELEELELVHVYSPELRLELVRF